MINWFGNQLTADQGKIVKDAKDCLAEELAKCAIKMIEGFRDGQNREKMKFFFKLTSDLYNPFGCCFLPKHYFFFDVFEENEAEQSLKKYYATYIENKINIPKQYIGEYEGMDPYINKFPLDILDKVKTILRDNGYSVYITAEMELYIAMNPGDLQIYV